MDIAAPPPCFKSASDTQASRVFSRMSRGKGGVWKNARSESSVVERMAATAENGGAAALPGGGDGPSIAWHGVQ